jgi:hypothetical protein
MIFMVCSFIKEILSMKGMKKKQTVLTVFNVGDRLGENEVKKYLLVLILACLPTLCLSQGEESQERRVKPVLSNSVYRPINEAQQAMQAGDYTKALQVLDELLERGDRLKAYDRAKIFHLKTIAFIQQQDYAKAATSSESALAINALELEAEKEMRYNLVNIYLILESYDQALAHLEIWIATYDDLDAQACFTAAQLYLTVEKIPEAQHYGEMGLAKHQANSDEPPRENWYRLMLSIYGHQKNYQQAALIAEQLLSFWPDKLEYYHQLSGLYQQLDRQKEAWAVLDIAYHNALLNKASDHERLLQMHRYFAYPHRGARIFTQAMESEIVTASEDHWESLANARLQARQWQLAESALSQAAALSDTGKHWLRLCQSAFQDERWQQSQQYCHSALDKGDLGSDEGSAWQLLAMINFNTSQYQSAMRYFERCSNHADTGKDCQDLLQHVTDLVAAAEAEAERVQEQARLAEERRHNRDQLIDQALLLGE